MLQGELLDLYIDKLLLCQPSYRFELYGSTASSFTASHKLKTFDRRRQGLLYVLGILLCEQVVFKLRKKLILLKFVQTVIALEKYFFIKTVIKFIFLRQRSIF